MLRNRARSEACAAAVPSEWDADRARLAAAKRFGKWLSVKIRPSAVTALLVAASSLGAGCNLAKVGFLSVAAAIGFAGYVVYKTGDAAVTGAGMAGEAVASGTRAVAKTVIYANGELRVEYPCDVRTVWNASGIVLRESGFGEITGSFDAFSGVLSAKTREGTDVVLKMRAAPSALTELRIRVGLKGDMGAAQVLDSLIQRKLPGQPVPATVPGAATQEEKR